jgi:hypothetical protein
MTIQSTIVFCGAGQKMPDAFVDKVRKDRPSGLGIMSAGKTGMTIEKGTNDITTKDIQDIREMVKDQDLYLWFFKGEGFLEDDVQPFVCIGNENEPHVAGMSSGKFLNFIPTASDHTNDYFLFNKYIIPKIMALKTDDLTVLFNTFTSDLWRIELTNSCGQHGTIVLMTSKGDNIYYDKNDLRRMYTWGWSSDHHDYVEEKPAETKPALKLGSKFKSMIGRPIASTEPIKPTVTPPPAPPTETKIPEPVGEQTYTPPKGLSNNALKQAYRHNIGSLPPNWRDRPTMPIPQSFSPKRIVKSFTEIPKDVATPIEKVPMVTDEFMPILSPDVIESVKHDFEKNLDKSSQVIPDPEKMLQDMAKWPSFWEATGISEDITDGWDDKTLYSLCVKYPKAAFLLMKNYRMNWLVAREPEPREVDQVDTSGTGVVKEEPKKPRKLRM